MADDLMDKIKSLVKPKQGPEAVLAEIEVTSTQLHNIANGNSCTLTDGMFGIRFLLKDSFKSGKSNFIINKYAIQVITSGKNNVMRTEHIATRVKLVKQIKKKVEKKVPEQIKIEVTKDDDDLF